MQNTQSGLLNEAWASFKTAMDDQNVAALVLRFSTSAEEMKALEVEMRHKVEELALHKKDPLPEDTEPEQNDSSADVLSPRSAGARRLAETEGFTIESAMD